MPQAAASEFLATTSLTMTTHGKGSANLTVKVYVNTGTDQQEIRRLVFEKEQPPLDYFTLDANIRRVFPYIAVRNFKLCWKGKLNIICVVTRLKS